MPSARARAVILRDDNILLIFRRKAGKEYWTLPGGGVEEDETPEQAVLREVMEETTVTVSIVRLLASETEDGETKLYYLCAYESGAPQLGEGPEMAKSAPDNLYAPQWVPLSRLDDLDLRAATRRAIQKVEQAL